jgi:hypothetical protein
MFSFSVANAQGTDSPGDIHTTVMTVAGHGAYVILNEANAKVWAAIHGLGATLYAWFVPSGGAGQNPHFWRRREVGSIASGSQIILEGGRKGLSGAPVSRARKARYKGRRLGPNRYATRNLIYDLDNRGMVIMVGIHLMARTQTVERWRWPLMLVSIARLRKFLWQTKLRYPGVPIIVAGDTNLKRLGALGLGPSWRIIQTPADMGRAHYTQVQTYGMVSVTNVRQFATKSDHKALVMDVQVWEHAPKYRAAS